MYLIWTDEFWTHQNIVIRNETKSKQILCLLSIKFRQRYIFTSCTYGKLKTDIFLCSKLYPQSKLGTFTVPQIVINWQHIKFLCRKSKGTLAIHARSRLREMLGSLWWDLFMIQGFTNVYMKGLFWFFLISKTDTLLCSKLYPRSKLGTFTVIKTQPIRSISQRIQLSKKNLDRMQQGEGTFQIQVRKLQWEGRIPWHGW